MTDSHPFHAYYLHYESMLSHPPDWDVAERNREAFERRSSWLPRNKEAKILDFGCGWGHQLVALWCSGYHNIEGVELVPEQANACKAAAAGRFEVHCMDGREFLGNKTICYVLVILNDVIEHIPIAETLPLLQTIYRALVPGGTVVIRTPNMSSILAAYSRYLDVTHLTGFTEFSIQQPLNQAGFEDHRFIPDSWGWMPRSWRPWAPWRGLAIRGFLNYCLHRIVYGLRGQRPTPTIFGMNLTIYSHKPKE